MEVVFSESAAGCLSVAAHKRKFTDAVSSAIIVGAAGESQSQNQEEIQKIVKESEQKERINWESMIPLEIERNDIFCFPLSLSFGDITEQEIGEQREKALKCLVNFYPDDVKPAALEMLSTAKKNLKELFCRAKKGESIRIWTSDTPDETCGFYWLINQLKSIGFENLDINYIKLPDFHVMPDGTVVIYSGWEEVAPHQWGNLARLGQKLPVNYMYALSFCWDQLKQENAPLRAVVNRQLVSVPEDFYDSFIFRELNKQQDEFMEAYLIGKVLGNYSLGIGDSFLALRIEKFIKDGILQPITKAKSEDPSYHRMLRKANKQPSV